MSGSGEDFIEWSWDPVDGVSGYDVQFSTNLIFTTEDGIVARTAEQVSYRREDLAEATDAYLRVRSASGTGEDRVTSGWSTHVNGMTTAPPPEPESMGNLFWVRVDIGDTKVSGRTVRVDIAPGESRDFEATLNARHLDAKCSVKSDGAAVTGECWRVEEELFRGTITGHEEGEVTITIAATHPGYKSAERVFGVHVEEPPPPPPPPPPTFDLEMWNELVFDALTCPNHDGSDHCSGQHYGYPVEQRRVRVLDIVPTFNIVEEYDDASFSKSEMDEIADAIEDGIRNLRNEDATVIRQDWDDGAVNIVPVNDLTSGSRRVCGIAPIGETYEKRRLRLSLAPICLEHFTQVVKHELGHVMGFFHVEERSGHIMDINARSTPDFTKKELDLMKCAFELGRDADYTSEPDCDHLEN